MEDAQAGKPHRISRLWLKLVAGAVVVPVFVAGFLWLGGGFDWVAGWAYLVLLACGQSFSGLVVWLKNPEVIRRRGEFGEGTKAWDKACLSLFGLSYAGILVVGALDGGRWGWSRMPGWLWGVGAGLYAFDVLLITWAMAVNAYFEKTVRIQLDRGHRVVDSGPYRLVRHPGYLGTIAGFALSVPFLLGSWWAFAPAGAAVVALMVRTALEDATLRRELPGYADYARRVRFRLVPGLW